MNPLVITIDGPAAAGKSTTARAVARRLGCLYLDSGAMYRALALKAERTGLSASLDDAEAVANLASTTEIGFAGPNENPSVVLDGVPLGEEIRTPGISELASRVAELVPVRKRISEIQRSLAQRQCLVAEGRDMGTVLFPDAAVKIFLDASVEERARRRTKELQARGLEETLEDVRREIERRDRRDRERDIAPLVPASDAIVLDTTGWSPEEQIARVLQAVESRVRPA